ncbi:MAG: hypothetical protein AAFV78_03425 [Bacteroidota bacterium]
MQKQQVTTLVVSVFVDYQLAHQDTVTLSPPEFIAVMDTLDHPDVDLNNFQSCIEYFREDQDPLLKRFAIVLREVTNKVRFEGPNRKVQVMVGPNLVFQDSSSFSFIDKLGMAAKTIASIIEMSQTDPDDLTHGRANASPFAEMEREPHQDRSETSR